MQVFLVMKFKVILSVHFPLCMQLGLFCGLKQQNCDSTCFVQV